MGYRPHAKKKKQNRKNKKKILTLESPAAAPGCHHRAAAAPCRCRRAAAATVVYARDYHRRAGRHRRWIRTHPGGRRPPALDPAGASCRRRLRLR